MLIYIILNASQSKSEYVCDSQQTIDSRPTSEKTHEQAPPLDQCVIGNQTLADQLLVSYQQTWLTQQANLFTVNLQTTVEGGVVWTVVDLATQEPNTDKEYFLLDPTDGLYEPAVGLDSANALFAQIQQEYLVFTNMNQYTTMTSWT
jgi:hypothetical protein